MTDEISRRQFLGGCAALAAAAGTSACGASPGEFLGSPLEYDRKWFFLPDAPRFFEDIERLKQQKPEGFKSDTDLDSWRLHFGALDASGAEVVPFTEDLSIPAGELIGLGAFGLAVSPFELLTASRKSKFQLQAAFGNEVEVTKGEFSAKRNAVLDFVAGKIVRDRSVMPMGKVRLIQSARPRMFHSCGSASEAVN